MKRLIRKEACMLVIFALVTAGVFGLNVRESSAVGETAADYTKLPAFLETGLNPNLLLVIDNSASMYDPAYVDAGGVGYCYAEGYDSTVAYGGYFETFASSWYVYDQTGTGQFTAQSETDAKAVCSGAAGTKYNRDDLCLTIDEGVSPSVVTAFAARGQFLNWLTSSKFDIEKEILTGGKYDDDYNELILETRGCLGKRFIKEVSVTDSGGTGYKATFGVRPPDDDEQASDIAYNGSLSNTRIEVFRVDPDGFDNTACELAIDEFLDPSGVQLGIVKGLTATCLGDATPSANSFNFIMQECWYYGTHGEWQPGQGTLTTMKNACEDVYDVKNPPVLAADIAAAYTAPEDLAQSEVCFGQYSPTIEDRYGYIGRCWETTYTTEGLDCTDKTCDPATATRFSIPDDECAESPCCYDNGDGTGVSKICSGNFNTAQGTCNKPWVAEQECVAVGAGLLQSIGWTNDDYYVDDSVDPPDLTLAADPDGARCIDKALKDFCGGLDQATVVDPSDEVAASATGTAIPSVLIDYAAVAQLGAPLLVLKGRVEPPARPIGLVHEFKYNLRIGAMAFNAGTREECEAVEDAAGKWVASIYDCLGDKGTAIDEESEPEEGLLDGGSLIAYIDEGRNHTIHLVNVLNDVDATTWTPTAEAVYSAVGYYAQNKVTDLRINPPTGDPALGLGGDFIRDSDWTLHFGASDRGWWAAGATYAIGDIVRTASNSLGYIKLYRAKSAGTSTVCGACWKIEDDSAVQWMPYDPVLAGCQSNNILLITDGGSTADINSGMKDFILGAGNDDADTASTWTASMTEPSEYECKDWLDVNNDGVYDVGETIVDKYFGSTLLDDVTAYGNNGSIYAYSAINGVDKEPILTHIVVAGSMRDDGTTNECNATAIMDAAATNGGTTLVQTSDLSGLEEALRQRFEAIGGEVSSGSAASVISHSRSGDGAMYQAIFYPKQLDSSDNEVVWTGDVHSLWLDAAGNIREDCGAAVRAATDKACSGAGDQVLDPTKDYIIEFYTNDDGSARAKRFIDADGDGNYDNSAVCSDGSYDNEADCLANSATWSYAANPDFVTDDVLLKDLNFIWSAADWLAEASSNQRSYDGTAAERYIFTMLLDADDQPGTVLFTKSDLAAALGSKYDGYFNAVTTGPASLIRTADGIVDYIRGLDQEYYRSRQMDWTDSAGLETVKLGDIVHSTPTLVAAPAENFDVVYGDPTYRTFRKKYQNRRAVVYAGGNDGGMHAFNGGYYDRQNDRFEKAPPVPGSDPVSYETQYDLGAELWMYVPKNIFPHLRWLTEMNYGDNHVYYIDAKPYIFDAKIFPPDADIHPGGWGTILVGGMRFGGGNIGVDTDGDDVDDETMQSAYFVMDITNPEYAPVVLAEFTADDLGFTMGSPNAIPLLRCDKNTIAGLAECNDWGWPMDWYLAFGSGPHDSEPAPAGSQAGMQGLSDQAARVYVMKLGGTATTEVTADVTTPDSLDYVGTGQVVTGEVVLIDNPPGIITGYPRSLGYCSDPSYTDEPDCLVADVWNPVDCFDWGVWSWDQATCNGNGAVWTVAGFCSHWAYGNETDCLNDPNNYGGPYTWTSSGYCDWDQVSCAGAERSWDSWWSMCYEEKTAGDCDASGGWWLPMGQGICSNPIYTHAWDCTMNGAIWTRSMGDSFFGDFIAVDYDLSFQVESLYFGSVSDTHLATSHGWHQGAMHRLVVNNDPNPSNWSLNLFYDSRSPVTAAPAVATDGERAWLFFGTGRFLSAKEDKDLTWSIPDGTWSLGLKEVYDSDGNMDLYSTNGGMLVDVSDVWVENSTGTLNGLAGSLQAKNVHTFTTIDLAADTFQELNDEISDLNGSSVDKYHGWKIKLEMAERIVGQPAILGDIVTFTSYIPSNDPCIPQGDSYLWAVYYRTGTAYMRSVMGLEDNDGTQEVLRRVSLGKGLSTTPNIHAGSRDGTTAFVQSSTGAIISIQQDNPGIVKSGMRSWRGLCN